MKMTLCFVLSFWTSSIALSKEDPNEISVLYAGYPGGEREKNFLDFLDQWFADVESIDLEQLNEKTAEDFDVIVADWKSQYDNGRPISGGEPNVNLGPNYAKPTITIGSIGNTLCGGKIDWL